jgi:hypothetical protein
MKRKIVQLILISFLVLLINCASEMSNKIGGWPEPKAGGGSEPSQSQGSVISYSVVGSANPQPTSAGGFVATSGSIAVVPRPSDEPLFGSVPLEPQEPSSGSSAKYLYHGENPSIEDLRSLGGDLKIDGSIKYSVLYDNSWNTSETAFWLDDETNSLYYIDRDQYVTYFEKYPDGSITTTDWGLTEKGYHTGWFSADKKGWHRVAIWGSESGWSNVVWIYVW